jgi:hypothetical protein
MYMTNLAAEAAPRQEGEADILPLLYAGAPLDRDQAETLFGALVRGALDEPAIAAMLVALKVRGETVEELIGAARALRAADLPFDAAGLSVRRQLRHRRRRLGHDQRLDRGRLRRRRRRPAGRQARQPLGHLALRLGRRARAARREARLRAEISRRALDEAASASCSRRNTIPACAMPGRCGARSASARS